MTDDEEVRDRLTDKRISYSSVVILLMILITLLDEETLRSGIRGESFTFLLLAKREDNAGLIFP